MKILVTGGAGYIGSHTVLELLKAKWQVEIIDNLSNSCEESLKRVARLAGVGKIPFHQVDIRDKAALLNIMRGQNFSGVIHFAGSKAVGESVAIPLHYYDNNVNGTISLLSAMIKSDVKTLVFSSSATVYGGTKTMPIDEDFPLKAQSPYGRTKLIIEDMLRDISAADKSFGISILRYFNPVGAHESGEIGEDPEGIPNNLVPFITQVAVGRLGELKIFGNDWPTKDGTGIRDYIHVMDLALGHLRALEFLRGKRGIFAHNLGTGHGYSVLDMVHAFERAANMKINFRFAPRRDGDVAQCWANPEKARKELNWVAKRDLDQICAHAWNWQKKNPQGYRK